MVMALGENDTKLKEGKTYPKSSIMYMSKRASFPQIIKPMLFDEDSASLEVGLEASATMEKSHHVKHGRIVSGGTLRCSLIPQLLDESLL